MTEENSPIDFDFSTFRKEDDFEMKIIPFSERFNEFLSELKLYTLVLAMFCAPAAIFLFIEELRTPASMTISSLFIAGSLVKYIIWFKSALRTMRVEERLRHTDAGAKRYEKIDNYSLFYLSPEQRKKRARNIYLISTTVYSVIALPILFDFDTSTLPIFVVLTLPYVWVCYRAYNSNKITPEIIEEKYKEKCKQEIARKEVEVEREKTRSIEEEPWWSRYLAATLLIFLTFAAFRWGIDNDTSEAGRYFIYCMAIIALISAATFAHELTIGTIGIAIFGGFLYLLFAGFQAAPIPMAIIIGAIIIATAIKSK